MSASINVWAVTLPVRMQSWRNPWCFLVGPLTLTWFVVVPPTEKHTRPFKTDRIENWQTLEPWLLDSDGDHGGEHFSSVSADRPRGQPSEGNPSEPVFCGYKAVRPQMSGSDVCCSTMWESADVSSSKIQQDCEVSICIQTVTHRTIPEIP